MARQAVASRAIIEQAKGALMLAYSLDAEAAFAPLCWQSQQENIKLRDVAQRLVATVAGDVAASAALRQRLSKVIYGLAAASPAAPPLRATTAAATGLVAAKQQTSDGAVVRGRTAVRAGVVGPPEASE
jgi:hypothetical protein